VLRTRTADLLIDEIIRCCIVVSMSGSILGLV
jgi:hypothetical protein